ncbi:MAG: hypothetical protein DRQ97_02880 [Gammaproteobacteria bacterium]|nr:MAG: hypothetical protein DRQ97_02880 [Gammaproteobacteria bacterium]
MSSDKQNALSTPNDSVFVILSMQVDLAKMDEFLIMMREAVEDTRAWEGCQMLDIYVDQDKPGRVVFYEIWTSRDEYETYFKWREDAGFIEKMADFITSELDISFLSKEG